MYNSNFSEINLNLSQKIRNSLTAKILMIGLVVLLCQIPILMVDGLIRSRQRRANDVEYEIASKWGYRQKVAGPLLAIPLSRVVKHTEKDGKNSRTVTSVEHSTYFAVPQNLHINGVLHPQMRYRGIYEVILYGSEITLKGTVEFPQQIPEWTVHWDKSALVLGIADLKGIANIKASVNQQPAAPAPGICRHAPFPAGISVFLQKSAKCDFEIKFDLNGCRELLFVMAGRQTQLDLNSPWPSPSFCGAFLPVKRAVTPEGFSASWSVSEFNRDLPAHWIGSEEKFLQPEKYLGSTEHYERSAGVALVKPADSYMQVNRAVEYAILVFIIVLMAMLIAEKLSKVWVHPLQYFIAALSLVLFYSLTLAISEHTSFGAAYIISTAALTALSTFYSALIYRKLKAALGMFLAVLAAYSAIYVILQLEDYALLAGSVILFILMTVLMAFTGRINRSTEPVAETE